MSFLTNKIKKILKELMLDKKFLFTTIQDIKKLGDDQGFRKLILEIISAELNKEDISEMLRTLAEKVGVVEPIQKDIITPQTRHLELLDALKRINNRLDDLEASHNELERTINIELLGVRKLD